MNLASITCGEPYAVRVYGCCHRTKRVLVDERFNRTPDRDEVAALLRRPLEFVRSHTEPEAA